MSRTFRPWSFCQYRQGKNERLMECEAIYYLTVFALSPLISFDNFPKQAMSSPAQTHLSLGWQ